MNLEKHFLEAGKTVVHKIWGTEYWVENNPQYCMKVLMLKPNFESSLHFHNVKKETFLCIEGLVHLEVYPDGVDNHGQSQMHLLRGWAMDSVTIEPGVPHRFYTFDGPAKIIEASMHHDDADTVRIEESREM